MRNIFLCLTILVALNSFAFDKYNSFMWNRQNYEAGSNKIDKKPWFEWWYYKVVIPETADSFYFTYGIVNPWDTRQNEAATRAYIGIGNFSEDEATEDLYPISDFKASYEATDIWVGENHATDKHIQGFINGKDEDIYWDISIETLWSYNAMGWGMHCYGITNIFWYPAQAAALFSGVVYYQGKSYHFDKAPGYQDRNWGRSFPEWWTWIASNYFEGYPDTVLAIGGGKPVIYGIFDFIEAVTIGLKHKGKIYEFRPNDFDRVKVNINFGTWEVEASNWFYKVEVSAYAPPEMFMDLQFLTPQGGIYHDYETLTGELTLKLYKRKGLFRWELIDTLYSNYAGIEFGSHDEEAFKTIFEEKVEIYKNY